jgi:hypothetical protein
MMILARLEALLDGHAIAREGLESLLPRLQSHLEEPEETIRFNLTYSSAHIARTQVRKDEQSLTEPRQGIASVGQLLATGAAPGRHGALSPSQMGDESPA